MDSNACGRESHRCNRAGIDFQAVIFASIALSVLPILVSRAVATEFEVFAEVPRRPVVAERPATSDAPAKPIAVEAPAEVRRQRNNQPNVAPQVNLQPGANAAAGIVLVEENNNQQANSRLTLFSDDTDGDLDLQPGEDSTIIRLLSMPKRAWGPEQAIGEPDTPGTGDIQSAWASQTTDAQTEWLQVEYAEPTDAKELHVYETFNPGALFKVSVFDKDGKEVTVWQGADPTPVGSGRGVSGVSIDVPFPVQRAKLYLDSTLVPGYNEIDAVGLKDAEGNMHWATNVKASSTYAPSVVTVPVNLRASDLIRLRALDKEVKQLRKEADRLQQLEKEVQQLKTLLREKSTNKQSP